jgi:hypothetical protein
VNLLIHSPLEAFGLSTQANGNLLFPGGNGKGMFVDGGFACSMVVGWDYSMVPKEK